MKRKITPGISDHIKQQHIARFDSLHTCSTYDTLFVEEEEESSLSIFVPIYVCIYTHKYIFCYVLIYSICMYDTFLLFWHYYWGCTSSSESAGTSIVNA